MVKKRIIISFFLILLSIFTVIPVAGATNDVPKFERISVYMPEINVQVKGSNYNKDDISASLGSETLTVSDVHSYDKAKDSTCVYILVDVSISMSTTFNTVKNSILKYINAMGVNDKLVLITFGTEIKTVLNGGESRDEIFSAVNNLACNERDTLLYEVLKNAYEFSNTKKSDFTREYILLFSDGIDSQWGNATYDEVEQLYNSSTLPVYIGCSSYSSKKATDNLGKISRISGGDMVVLNQSNDFDSFVQTINDVTVMSFKAANNLADGSDKKFTVKIGSNIIESTVSVSRSIPDNIAPEVETSKYNVNNNSIVIKFTENVTGISYMDSYRIYDYKGNEVEISSIVASEPGAKVEIMLGKAIRNGTYSVEFSEIYDYSEQRNPITSGSSISVEDAGSSVNTGVIIGIIIGILIVFAIILLAIVLTSDKKDSEDKIPVKEIDDKFNNTTYAERPTAPLNSDVAPTEPLKYKVKLDSSINVILNIKIGKSPVKALPVTIESSLIVGRSDVCDLCLEDTKISRQHFVVENINNVLYLSDLHSRNGTFLNGGKVLSRTKLKSGDNICAGLTDIRVQF